MKLKGFDVSGYDPVICPWKKLAFCILPPRRKLWDNLKQFIELIEDCVCVYLMRVPRLLSAILHLRCNFLLPLILFPPLRKPKSSHLHVCRFLSRYTALLEAPDWVAAVSLLVDSLLFADVAVNPVMIHHPISVKWSWLPPAQSWPASVQAALFPSVQCLTIVLLDSAFA